MKNPHYLLIAVVVCLAHTANSQSTFENGYVVLTNGDTLRGAINNRDWKTNPKSIEFRSASGDLFNYTPAEITRFYLEKSNENFRAVSMIIDKSPTEADHVTEESHLLSAQETLFLRVLVNGPIALLHSFDFKDHFYFEKGGEVTELLHQARLVRGKNPYDSEAGVHTQRQNSDYRTTGDKLLLKRNEKYKFQLINALRTAKHCFRTCNASLLKRKRFEKCSSAITSANRFQLKSKKTTLLTKHKLVLSRA